MVHYYDNDIQVQDTELSEMSPLPICIVLTLPELIGTHEATQEEGLQGVDFSTGWHGAPIATATLNESILDKLGEGIHVVENIEYGDFGVLDGHHRREMAERSGLAYAITQIIPLISPHVIIGTWLENFSPLKAHEVAEYFKRPEEVVAAKATKFQIVGKDGIARRIAEMQPIVSAPLKLLQNRL